MSNRSTALALVLAIVAAELLLSGHAQAAWKAMWGTVRGLGQEAAGGGGSGSSGALPGTGGFPAQPTDPNDPAPGVFTT